MAKTHKASFSNNQALDCREYKQQSTQTREIQVILGDAEYRVTPTQQVTPGNMGTADIGLMQKLLYEWPNFIEVTSKNRDNRARPDHKQLNR